jgi:hypothetical protein
MGFDYEGWKKLQLSEEETDTAPRAAFPLSVMWAGIIWAAVGGVILLTVLALSWQAGTIRSPGSILASLLFLYGGLRAISGTTPGTLRSGIASIVLGLIWIGAGVFMTTLVLPSNGTQVILLSGGMGGALILAGSLAVIGGKNYQKWRHASADGNSPAREP